MKNTPEASIPCLWRPLSLGVVFILACGAPSDSPTSEAKVDPAPPPVETSPRPAEAETHAGDPAAYQPRRAVRCAGCHEESYAQWEGSAHATSHSGPYQASLESAKTAGADLKACASCHEPLAQASSDHQALLGEGVTCEACHGIAEITEKGSGAPRALYKLADNMKYGPNCDAKDHYFHKMGCAPHVEASSYCGSCHELEVRLGDGTKALAISEFSDWKKSDYVDAMTCQDCHMPWENKEAAVGTGKSRSRGHHGDRGPDDKLSRDALEITVTSQQAGGALEVTVALTNKGAGHALPAGLPSRRLLIEVVALGPDGSELAKAQQSLGQHFLRVDGSPAAFFEAHSRGEDTRLAAGETRSLVFTLATTPADSVHATVYDQPLDPALASSWGIEAAQLREIAESQHKVKR